MKKLIFAVLALGLVLSFSTALAADSTATVTSATTVTTTTATTTRPAQLFSFYAGVGYSKSLDSLGADKFGGSIAGQIGVNYRLTPEFMIGAMAGYYLLGNKTFTIPLVTGTGTDSSATTKFTYSVIPICGVATYDIPTTSTFKPYVSVGAGAYILHAKADVTTTLSGLSGSTSSNTTKFGANGGVGFEIMSTTSNIGFGAEARFHMITKAGNPDENGNAKALKLISAIAAVHFH